MSESAQPGLRPPPFAKLMERMGITEEDLDSAAEPVEGEEFVKHAEFERQTDAEGRTRYREPTSCEGMLRIQDQSGMLWICECDVCGFEVGVQMAKIDPGRLLEHRFARAGLPDGFVGKRFDRGDPEQEPTLEACRMWIGQFQPTKLADSIPAIALWGKPGRGKTHLLSLMVETVIKLHAADAMYRSASELLDELQAGFDEQTYEGRWQRALRVPVLALDDLGAGRWTDWRRDRFEALVDYRYAHALPLLIATNIPPGGWDRVFGDRPASRLRGMCLRFELRGEDRRAQGVQQTLGEAAA